MLAINTLTDTVRANAESHDERLHQVEESVNKFKGWLAALGVGLVLLESGASASTE